ncbi:MAG TPA: N-acetylneuraminate synthase family protein [Candidatus Binatia bacterium]|jgi:N-acetylneuraminate synthase|nr:N-acetylneuraminate synthase family protein [Candidatus Binatia bacterium]
MDFRIGKRSIGPDHGNFVVAEVAQAHDGSLGMAHAFIDAIASTGADAVKFQTHIAAAESTPGEPWRTQGTLQEVSRYDYWKRMEFSEEQWRSLAEHAREKGLIFLSSPFSIEAVELLTRLGVPAWKVGSGEVGNLPLLRHIVQSGLPIIFSSGMSLLGELDEAVAAIKSGGVPYAVLQCTSAYPCPPEKIGLNLIPLLKERYRCPVGLSDHSGTIFPGLAAAALGIEILEIHVTLSREMFGPDVTSSVTTSELRQLVDGVRFIEKMRRHPIDKDLMAKEMEPLRRIFNKSVVAKRDMDAGTILREDLLTVKKPGTGIPARKFYDIIGRRLRRRVVANTILQEEDLEETVSHEA